MGGRIQIHLPESALVPNGFSVAQARRDESDERESRPDGREKPKVIYTHSGE